jgi:hypothetical protein
MSNILEKIWKKTVVVLSRYYPGIFLADVKKTIKTLVVISSVFAEILAKHMPNTSLDHYL